MKLLAWDTSSKVGALVAMEWGTDSSAAGARDKLKLMGEWTFNAESTHSERVLWAIHQLLESCRWKLSDIDVFGVGVGPGSFTGIRIGVTTARTLAHTLGKPLVQISSLAALARPAAEWLSASSSTGQGRSVIVCSTDAAKGELFALWGDAGAIKECVCMPENGAAGLWNAEVKERVLTAPDLMAAVHAELDRDGTKWFAIGEGRKRYLDDWKGLPADRENIPPLIFLDQVQGRYLGILAWEAYQAGLARTALDVHPRYIRASDPELKLKAGLLKPSPQSNTPTGLPET